MKLKAGAMRKRARGLIHESWQSQANLSFFLLLLVFTGFLLPSLGFAKHDLRLYSDIAFTLMLISGVAIAWGQRKLFVVACVVATVALVVRWLALWKETPKLQLWGDTWTLLAILIIALILLVQVFSTGPVTHLRIQGAIAVYLLLESAGPMLTTSQRLWYRDRLTIPPENCPRCRIGLTTASSL